MSSGEGAAPAARAVREAWLVFLLLFATYACFLESGGWNMTTRIAMTAALVEHGSLSIDGYEDLTGDRAVRDGHYYSDKAPGMSLLAIPAAFIVTRIAAVEPRDFGRPAWFRLAYVCTLTGGLISALAGAALFLYLRRRTGQLEPALVGALLFGFATPIFGWSTTFFGHATSAALLLLGFIGLEPRAESGSNYRRAALGGAVLGLAVCVEYTAAVAAAIIGVAAMIQIYQRAGRGRAVRFFAATALGGLAGFSPALVYNWLAFGAPLTLGYQYVSGFEGMKTGLFGIGVPRISILIELLFGLKRGVVWICPALLLIAFVWLRAVRKPALRATCITAALVAAWYFSYNAGYAYWDGGWSTGPRHLTPAFALLSLTLGLGWQDLTPRLKAAGWLLLGASLLVNLAAASVEMTSRDTLMNPIFEHILPDFFRGAHTSAIAWRFSARETWLNLTPVLAIWFGWSLFFFRQHKKSYT